MLIPTEVFHTRRTHWVMTKLLDKAGADVIVQSIMPRGHDRDTWWRQGATSFRLEIAKISLLLVPLLIRVSEASSRANALPMKKYSICRKKRSRNHQHRHANADRRARSCLTDRLYADMTASLSRFTRTAWFIISRRTTRRSFSSISMIVAISRSNGPVVI